MDRPTRAAMDFLRENKVTKLPVPIEGICRQQGYIVMSYNEAHELIDELTITAVLQEKDGITIPARDHFYILYRDNLSEDRRRMVIAHEIGHIILHYGSGLVGYAADEKKQADIDAECDTFARAFLAPFPALEYVDSVETIIKRTKLPPDEAKIVFSDIMDYRSKFERVHIYKSMRGQFLHVRLAESCRRHGLMIAVIIFALVCVGGFFLGKYVGHTESPAQTSNTASQREAIYDNPQSDVVYVTRYGDKYHRLGCQHIKGKDNLQEITILQAEDAGYDPCSVCMNKNN